MSIIAAGTTTTTALSSTGNTDGTLQFQVNGTTASVTLNTLGAIGVGSTPAFGTAGQVLTSAGSTAAPTWSSVTSSQWVTTGSNIYYNTGNVGIGTASPAELLHLNSSTNTRARIETTSTGSVAVTQYKNAAGETHTIGSETSAGNAGFGGASAYAFCMYAGGTTRNICFGTNGAERMRLDSSGNLGIGTTTANISGGGAGTQVLTLSASASARNAVIELKGTRTSADQVSSYIRSFSNSAVTPGVDLQFYRGTADTDGFLTISTSNTERLRIAANGAFGLSGANYGTSGQVLTSGGSGAAPTWSTPSSGALTLISTTVLPGSATDVTITSGISTTYTKYKIVFQGVYGTNNNPPQMRFYAGGSVDANSVYGSCGYIQVGGTNTPSNNTSTSIMLPASGASIFATSTNTYLYMEMDLDTIFNTSGGTYQIKAISRFSVTSQNSTRSGVMGMAYNGSSGNNAAVTGIYMFNMGTLNGTISIYGVS